MRILQILASVILLVAFSFLFALPTSATTLPQLLSHDGLTFDHPLIISQSEFLKPTVITFGEINEIVVKQPTESTVLAETIVSPPPVAKRTLLKEVIPVAEAEESTKRLSSSPTPTQTPTPTTTPTPSPTQTPASLSLSNGGLDADKLFSMSNAYRQERGLPPFQKDERSCQLAASRAPEIAAEVAGGHMHSGLKARNLPYWNSENIISMRTEEAAFTWWVNDKIHHDAIVGIIPIAALHAMGILVPKNLPTSSQNSHTYRYAMLVKHHSSTKHMEQQPEQIIVDRKQYFISHEKMTLILCFVFVLLAFGGILLLASFGESPKTATAAKNQKEGELAPFPKSREVAGEQYGPYNGPVGAADKKVTPSQKTTPTNTPTPEPTAAPTATPTPQPNPTSTPQPTSVPTTSPTSIQITTTPSITETPTPSEAP